MGGRGEGQLPAHLVCSAPAILSARYTTQMDK
jgi:hypothetical protein